MENVKVKLQNQYLFGLEKYFCKRITSQTVGENSICKMNKYEINLFLCRMYKKKIKINSLPGVLFVELAAIKTSCVCT